MPHEAQEPPETREGHDPHHTDHQRTGHHDTGHHQTAPGSAGRGAGAWPMAARATLHCLTGCAIGEVLGMIVGTALGWGNLPTTVLAIVLAFFFGYLLTLRGVLAAGLSFQAALRVALAADTVSIAVMEAVDNGVIALWPDAMDATLSETLFWVSLAVSLGIAFLAAWPVNKWLIGRGKGHAVAHAHHH